MSKQETLINKLEQRKQDFEPRFASDFWILEGLDKAINIVKEYNEWVNVNDSLPNENEIVLVYKQGFGVMGIAKYSANVFWYFDLNGNKHHFKSMSGITHYKSLPSPPSEV